MILHVMSLFDKKARAFNRPFFVAHVDLGVRSLAGEVNQQASATPPSELARFPEDFALYTLGTFDDGTGHFQLTATPTIVCEAVALKKGASLV